MKNENKKMALSIYLDMEIIDLDEDAEIFAALMNIFCVRVGMLLFLFFLREKKNIKGIYIHVKESTKFTPFYFFDCKF